MYFKQRIGKYGEELAEAYLKLIGYKILEKNFRCSRGEIDIIALDNSQIVFIEIKLRTSKEYGQPSEAVTEKKLNRIYKTAEYFLHVRNLLNQNTRIDVVEIYSKPQKCYINHLKQVI